MNPIDPAEYGYPKKCFDCKKAINMGDPMVMAATRREYPGFDKDGNLIEHFVDHQDFCPACARERDPSGIPPP